MAEAELDGVRFKVADEETSHDGMDTLAKDPMSDTTTFRAVQGDPEEPRELPQDGSREPTGEVDTISLSKIQVHYQWWRRPLEDGQSFIWPDLSWNWTGLKNDFRISMRAFGFERVDVPYKPRPFSGYIVEGSGKIQLSPWDGTGGYVPGENYPPPANLPSHDWDDGTAEVEGFGGWAGYEGAAHYGAHGDDQRVAEVESWAEPGGLTAAGDYIPGNRLRSWGVRQNCGIQITSSGDGERYPFQAGQAGFSIVSPSLYGVTDGPYTAILKFKWSGNYIDWIYSGVDPATGLPYNHRTPCWFELCPGTEPGFPPQVCPAKDDSNAGITRTSRAQGLLQSSDNGGLGAIRRSTGDWVAFIGSEKLTTVCPDKLGESCSFEAFQNGVECEDANGVYHACHHCEFETLPYGYGPLGIPVDSDSGTLIVGRWYSVDLTVGDYYYVFDHLGSYPIEINATKDGRDVLGHSVNGGLIDWKAPGYPKNRELGKYTLVMTYDPETDTTKLGMTLGWNSTDVEWFGGATRKLVPSNDQGAYQTISGHMPLPTVFGNCDFGGFLGSTYYNFNGSIAEYMVSGEAEDMALLKASGSRVPYGDIDLSHVKVKQKGA